MWHVTFMFFLYPDGNKVEQYTCNSKRDSISFKKFHTDVEKKEGEEITREKISITNQYVNRTFIAGFYAKIRRQTNQVSCRNHS